MPKYTRILSIDGGGIRGIIPAMVLAKLERILQKKTGQPDAKLAEFFDLVAGTSTGGIIACGMLIPKGKAPNASDPPKPRYAISEIADIYLDRGDEIFGRKKLVAHIGQFVGGLANIGTLGRINAEGASYLFDERYFHDELLEALHDFMGDWRLSDLLKPTLITAYDIKRRKAHFFCQHEAKNPDKNFFVRDVAWATAAAPTYFEVSRIKSESQKVYPFIDGGVFANNPALCAYAEARTFFDHKPKAKDMAILSIGTTGRPAQPPYSYDKAKDWGAVKWVKAFVDITLSGVSETVTYQLKQIYDAVERPKQFVRIDPELAGASPDLDDASPDNLEKLKAAGKKAAKDHKKKLEDFAELLLKKSGPPVG